MYKLQCTTRNGKTYAISPDGKLVPMPAGEKQREQLRHEFEILHYELQFDVLIEWLSTEDLHHPDYEKKVAELHRLEAKLKKLLEPAVTMAQSGINEISTIDLKRK